ncbi:hypothetical protein AciX8_1822 [Granulicella mallensis MP5ACTX8]|uniref:Uncharacterized protein n=1 Tax=Granulicella mallensis (strain ATCC BAA-1857 / DSM 23137 / MP5ACTX8) TaxID=682795 RepID=G8NR81_GRAMM|nr:hypothetical protein AciX8_1822 [Granulicella mallensis MP5ACTX8]
MCLENNFNYFRFPLTELKKIPILPIYISSKAHLDI